jgi:Lysyl oxidase
MSSRLRPVVARSLVLVLTTALLGAGAALPANATPVARPTLRLIAASDEVSAVRYGRGPVQLDLGMYVGAVGGAFELRARRASYHDPVVLRWYQYPGSAADPWVSLPSTMLDEWNGLRNFFRFVATDDGGNVVFSRQQTFCPNTSDYVRARIDDSGPMIPTYPETCGGSWFTRGMVWGIDRGWATGAFGFGTSARLKDGHYYVTLSIEPQYLHAFGISPADGTTTVGVTVSTYQCPPPCFPPGPGGPPAHGPGTPPAAVPTVNDPSRDEVPDLAVLPAYRISTGVDGGKDILSFSATVGDAGPAPLDVEGFRAPGSPTMVAYQYFYRDGVAVGRTRAGTFEFDTRLGHEHWHIEQFASYSLLDANKQFTVASHKQSFCLAPTDAIDLTVPGAEWKPYQIGLGSACGGQSALWIRETIPTGWGDTYTQSVAGQAFNITDVPNGTYYIEVQASPTGLLHERNIHNNVQLRRVILGGTVGARTVRVPKWNGIDTEDDGFPCLPPCPR